MPIFDISTYPAKVEPTGTSIAITNRIRRVTVECKLDELPAKLKEVAEATPLDKLGNLNMNAIHAWADPVGRAPNGYKAFSAARKDTYNHIPAEVPAGWEKV